MNNIIHTSLYDSPCGRIVLGSLGDALCLCDWDIPARRNVVDARLARDFDATFVAGDTVTTDNAKRQLDQYFGRVRKDFDIALAVSGSDFRRTVWHALSEIKYGTVVSYGSIARRIGRDEAVRAVASAIGANPLSIFIPCHRVIAADGSLAGYAGTLPAKRHLLFLETDRHFL